MKHVKIRTDPGGMNKLERAYADHLGILQRIGEVTRWRFEPLKFKLGKACFYTPDFEVVAIDGTLEYHEVKGHWREDARVKIKAVAALFRDRKFLAVTRPRKAWIVEVIDPPAG